MTVVSPAPRRSGRERRKVESIYDEARKASAVKEDAGSSTEEESVKHNEDSEASSDEEPQPKSKSKKTVIQIGRGKKSSAKKPKKSPPKSTARTTGTKKGKAGQKQLHTSLSTLSRTVLPPSDRDPHLLCLVSCLLNSWRPSKDSEDDGVSIGGMSTAEGMNSAGVVSALNVDSSRGQTSVGESPYASNLTALSKRLIHLHNEDSNLAQVALVNLLFRSVGGGKESDLADGRASKAKKEDDDTAMDEDSDAEKGPAILEEMDTNEWARAVTDLVDDMRHRPANQILICADPRGAVHQASVLSGGDKDEKEGKGKKGKEEKQSMGVREYRKIYTEFWYILSSVGLTCGGMATEGEGEQVLRLDAQLVKSILQRLIELSPVGQPDVRSGACLAALSMSHAVLDHSVAVLKKLEVAKRQLAASKKSGGGEKAESLKMRVESLKRTLGDLEEVVDLVVQGLFVHRYRDSNEHIRTLCLQSLSRFSLQRPDIFLTDKYLKYFGWMMSDKSPFVRSASISGLLSPFTAVRRLAEGKSKESGDEHLMVDKIDLSAMEHVVAKFLKRIADSVLDVDEDVQEVAIELMLDLLKAGFLDDVEDDDLWNQVNCRALAKNASPKVRKNALSFVLEQLEPFDDGDEEDKADISTERKRTQQIDSIASFAAHTMTSGNRPVDKIQVQLADYLVQSLREMPEHRSLVTDWSAMLRAIKDDKAATTASNVRAGEKANVAKQRVLVRMLACAAREEVGSIAGESFLQQDMDTDSIEKKDKKSTKANLLGREHERCSLALLTSIPSLLLQFKGDLAIIPELVNLPRYILPTVLSLPQRKQDAVTLIKNLGEVYLSSSDDKILFNTAHSMVSLSKGEHARVSEAKTQLRKVVVELRDRLCDLMAGDDATVATSAWSLDKSDLTSNNSKKRRSRKKSSDNSAASSQSSLTDGETAAADTEYSIYLNLKRLRCLAKRTDLSVFFGNGDEINQLELLCNFVCDGINRRLRSCKPLDIRIEGADEETTVQKLITSPEMLAAIGKSVQEGLQFVLSVIAWSLDKVQREENLVVSNEDLIDEEPDMEDDDEEDEDHIVIRLRNRLLTVLELCFAQYIPSSDERDDDETTVKHSPAQLSFADFVQLSAGNVIADLRTLFPKEYAEASSPLLRSFALAEDGRLVGAFVRFLGSKEHFLRDNDSGSENRKLPQSLLLPMGRAIVANWNTGNRREAGMFLRHISSSGPTAASIVSASCKEMKKIDPVRLLESQMASLRQSYENWVDEEPELDSERPTEEEMTDYEAEEQSHREQFASLEQRASQFSQSLGVFGNLSDGKLAPALDGFVREGVRFSFSNIDANGEDTLVLGSRLSFLLLLSKYSNWVKKNKKSKAQIQPYIDQLELDMRNHEEFDQVHEDDLDALQKYRQSVGLKSLPKMSSTVSVASSQASIVRDGDADDESMDSVSDLGATPSSHARSAGRPSSASTRKSHSSMGSASTRKSRSSLNVSALPTLPEGEQEESPEDLEVPHSDHSSDDDTEARSAVVLSTKRNRAAASESEESEEEDAESVESAPKKKRRPRK